MLPFFWLGCAVDGLCTFLNNLVAVFGRGCGQTPAVSAFSKWRWEGWETALPFSMLCTVTADALDVFAVGMWEGAGFICGLPSAAAFP
jgi:hypothetical protein